jgi:hypothetical protein
MEKSSQIAWKLVPLTHFFPLKVALLIEVLLYPKPLVAYGLKPGDNQLHKGFRTHLTVKVMCSENKELS